MEKRIVISTEFSDAPGARFITDGPKSGEEFYNTLLKSAFDEVLAAGGKLIIDFDDTWGYASSFISGSFGRLSKAYGAEKVLKHLAFKSDDDDTLIPKVIAEIKDPTEKK